MNIEPEYPDYTYIEYCEYKKEIRDKFLTEAIGECWHETNIIKPYHYGEVINICKCGEHTIVSTEWNDKSYIWKRLDFSTWEGFGKLWQWMIQQDWNDVLFISKNPCGVYNYINGDLINPNNFANTIYHYLIKKRK